MLPIDRYLSGWLNGFFTGAVVAGLILLIVFLIFEWKRRRSHTSSMRNF